MALGERTQGELEHIAVDGALQPERCGCVIGDAVVGELAEKPEELLRVGERDRAEDVPPGDGVLACALDAPFEQPPLEQLPLRGTEPREACLETRRVVLGGAHPRRFSIVSARGWEPAKRNSSSLLRQSDSNSAASRPFVSPVSTAPIASFTKAHRPFPAHPRAGAPPPRRRGPRALRAASRSRRRRPIISTICAASVATVGALKRLCSGSSTAKSLRTWATTCVASSEWPPSAKKSSFDADALDARARRPRSRRRPLRPGCAERRTSASRLPFACVGRREREPVDLAARRERQRVEQ